MGKTDAELVELIKKKDVEALKEVIRRHKRKVYSLAVSVLGNAAEAEEITQDVFIKLWSNIEYFDTNKPQALSTWLLAICKNAAIDRLRKRKKIAYVEIDEVANDSNVGVILDGPELHLMKLRIANALNYLPKEQREVIEMVYFNGLTQKEIAASLNIPLGTVKSRIRLALTKLKGLLSHDEEGRVHEN